RPPCATLFAIHSNSLNTKKRFWQRFCHAKTSFAFIAYRFFSEFLCQNPLFSCQYAKTPAKTFSIYFNNIRIKERSKKGFGGFDRGARKNKVQRLEVSKIDTHEAGCQNRQNCQNPPPLIRKAHSPVTAARPSVPLVVSAHAGVRLR